MGLSKIFQWVLNRAPKLNRAPNAEVPSSIYVSLGPTDQADVSKIYSDALSQALTESDIKNIALTGPYGSGKSSIIRSFLKNYKKPYLSISLAAFLTETQRTETEDDGRVKSASTKQRISKQEIERSILQQMLYAVDANCLPLSRFKRIQVPKGWSSWFISLFALTGLFACWYLIEHRLEIASGVFFEPFSTKNWFNYTSFVLGTIFLLVTFRYVYTRSLSISFKSISLKDIELTPDVAREESILNRHLDEIIYFFQSTEYDLVVIEDLDRFENPDIFVTLREINSLINANSGVKRPIRFLYALRDNMFVSTERTKFFEFIIPVIPIINSSNSIDKVIEHGERLKLEEKLNRQFLREVSRYLNDLRLIQNIFNEYAIYVSNLATDEEYILDENKLLAILIYKNVLPGDFEELHRQKGLLASIFADRDDYINSIEASSMAEIRDLENQLEDTHKQLPSNINELRKVYAMAIIAKMPDGYNQFRTVDNNFLPINKIMEAEGLEELIDADTVQFRAPNNSSRNVDIRNLQSDVDASKSYKERKAIIENKSSEFKESILREISRIRGEISTIRTQKFNEIIRAKLKSTADLFSKFEENEELVKFLVLEGYIDDSYYQYTSLFHEGRLSPNDNKFLIQIRSFNNPEPSFQIDNPKEVIAAMRDDDFSQNYVLNKTIVDCLLGSPQEYDQQIRKLNTFISENFEECRDFFLVYYNSGSQVPRFCSRLYNQWPDFLSTAISSSEKLTHVSQFISKLPENDLENAQNTSGKLAKFLSKHLSKVLAQKIDFDPSRLKKIELEVDDLTSTEPYPQIARTLIDGQMYKISVQNLDFVFQQVHSSVPLDDLQKKHYSTVLASKDELVIEKIESQFDIYLNSVLLELDRNSEESIEAIVKAINHEETDVLALEAFIKKQSAILPILDNIPKKLHPSVFALRKIEASWENCLAYVLSDTFEKDVLTDFLSDVDVKSTLSEIKITSDDQTLPLVRFLLKNNEFENGTYRTFIRLFSTKFKGFPKDLDIEKWQILVEEYTVAFSKESFSSLDDFMDLQVLFLANNIEVYLKNSDQYEIDDEFREALLASELSDASKLQIIDMMDLSLVPSQPKRAAAIGEVLYRLDSSDIKMTDELAQSIIINTTSIEKQIFLLNRYQNVLSIEQVREVLPKLPKPFSKIRLGWDRPVIPNTSENCQLVEWLENRGIISSSKLSFYEDEIRIYNCRK